MASIKFYEDIYDGTRSNRMTSRWYDLKDYTRVMVSWISRYGPSGIPTEEFSECRYWLMDQLESEIIIKEENEGIGYYVYFYFLSDEDLLKFKLSPWGGKCIEWQPDKY
jgi:hypothetical protein